MSPCYNRASLAIHFTWKQEWEAVRRLLPIIERELAPFDVRPHWGKLFSIPSAQLQAAVREVRRLQAARRALDPQGKFRNAFLTTNLYG